MIETEDKGKATDAAARKLRPRAEALRAEIDRWLGRARAALDAHARVTKPAERWLEEANDRFQDLHARAHRVGVDAPPQDKRAVDGREKQYDEARRKYEALEKRFGRGAKVTPRDRDELRRQKENLDHLARELDKLKKSQASLEKDENARRKERVEIERALEQLLREAVEHERSVKKVREEVEARRNEAGPLADRANAFWDEVARCPDLQGHADWKTFSAVRERAETLAARAADLVTAAENEDKLLAALDGLERRIEQLRKALAKGQTRRQ